MYCLLVFRLVDGDSHQNASVGNINARASRNSEAGTHRGVVQQYAAQLMNPRIARHRCCRNVDG